jgi:hypothetical protein
MSINYEESLAAAVAEIEFDSSDTEVEEEEYTGEEIDEESEEEVDELSCLELLEDIRELLPTGVRDAIAPRLESWVHSLMRQQTYTLGGEPDLQDATQEEHEEVAALDDEGYEGFYEILEALLNHFDREYAMRLIHRLEDTFRPSNATPELDFGFEVEVDRRPTIAAAA